MSEPLDKPQRGIIDGKAPCLSVVMTVFNEKATVENLTAFVELELAIRRCGELD